MVGKVARGEAVELVVLRVVPFVYAGGRAVGWGETLLHETLLLLRCKTVELSDGNTVTL